MGFDNLSIIIPYNSQENDRERNWEWIKRRYEMLMPDAELCMGECYMDIYCKSFAINEAVRKSTKDFLLIIDADIIMRIEDIEKALLLAEKYGIVAPVRLVKFSQLISENIINNNYIEINDSLIDNNTLVYRGIFTGICIIKKSIFINSGGYDERFVGWGHEDVAFMKCMDKVNSGIYKIPNFTIYHLYHQYNPQNKNKDLLNKNKRLLDTQYNPTNIQKTIEYLKKINQF